MVACRAVAAATAFQLLRLQPEAAIHVTYACLRWGIHYASAMHVMFTYRISFHRTVFVFIERCACVLEALLVRRCRGVGLQPCGLRLRLVLVRRYTTVFASESTQVGFESWPCAMARATPPAPAVGTGTAAYASPPFASTSTPAVAHYTTSAGAALVARRRNTFYWHISPHWAGTRLQRVVLTQSTFVHVNIQPGCWPRLQHFHYLHQRSQSLDSITTSSNKLLCRRAFARGYTLLHDQSQRCTRTCT